MVEIVTQINSAEEQADEIRKSARLQARQMLEEAVAAGKALVESESRRAAEKAAEAVSAAGSKAQAYLDENAGKAAAESGALSDKAKARMQKAASFIVERIVAGL